MNFVSKSLISKILISHAGAIFLTVCLLGGTGYWLMRHALTRLQQERLEFSVRTLARELDAFLEDAGDHLSGLEIEDYHRTYRGLLLAKHFTRQQGIFPLLSYLNQKGQEEVKVVRGKISQNLLDRSILPLFRQSLAQPNEVFCSGPFYDRELQEKVIYLAFTKVGYFGDEYMGTVYAALGLKTLQKKYFTHPLGRSGYFLLTDQRGKILTGSRLPPGAETVSNDPHLLEQLAAHRGGLQQASILGLPAMVAYQPVTQSNWTLLAVLPMGEFMAHPRHLLVLTALIALFTLAVVALVAHFFTRRVIGNIARIHQHTKRVSAGDLDQFLHISSGDELEALAHSFNRMTLNIKTATQAKDALNKILQSIMDPLLITDHEGRIKDANPSALRLFKEKRGVLRQRTLASLFPESPFFTDPDFKERLSTRPVIDYETTIQTRDGRVVPVLLSSSLIDHQRPAYSGLVAIIKDITHRKEAEQRIEQLAFYDSLTALPNRLFLREHLKRRLYSLKRQSATLFLLFIDLDNFKMVNDTLGHSAGDKLLQAAARRIRSSLRQSDLVCRLGGDEFIIVLEQINSPQNASLVAQKIAATLTEPFEINHHKFLLSASIGIASYPQDGTDGETLLKNADMAMYHAKEQGKSTYQFFCQEMNAKVKKRLFLEKSLREALKHEQFEVYYQPKLLTADRRICGAEALVRWIHPQSGPINPSQFIPLAEEMGLILPLGEWVLETAFQQARAWQEAGYGPFRMAVNLSGVQLRKPELPDIIRRILLETRLNPTSVELEVTESTLMEDVEITASNLHQLRDLGICLAIDDFGTGYSSLSYLNRFPIDILKIDRSFIKDIERGGDIAKAVITLAHSFGLSVTAEGVETEAQEAFLKEHQCEELQGFLYGRPMPATAFSFLLSQQARPADSAV